MPRPLLSAEQCAEALKSLPGWEIRADGKAICKSFVFKTFATAFGFMTDVADAAETLHHHPDWSNVYNRVAITLNTHDSGGVTQLDIDLALRIEDAARDA